MRQRRRPRYNGHSATADVGVKTHIRKLAAAHRSFAEGRRRTAATWFNEWVLSTLSGHSSWCEVNGCFELASGRSFMRTVIRPSKRWT